MDKRALVLTYTRTNQAELRSRLAGSAGDRLSIDVIGWFGFLLRDFARPFLPFKFKNKRVLGFNFDGRPHRLAAGLSRFLDADGAVYGCELGRLAHELIGASGGALLRRLECVYDEIIIDEVQDLCGHDWEIIDGLLSSAVEVLMVGDLRQAVLSTNPRSAKNKQYRYAEVLRWFREREARGVLSITEDTTTWRCHSKVAEFSDTIFDSSWGFPETISKNHSTTGHDGVFLLRQSHVGQYAARFRPQCLRDSANSGKSLDLDYMNFRVAKGLTFERVLIVPTSSIQRFIQSGEPLDPIPASKLYVAVTRAAQSVAVVLDDPGRSALPYWEPEVSPRTAASGTPLPGKG